VVFCVDAVSNVCCVIVTGKSGSSACTSVRIFISARARSVAEVCSVSHQCNAAAGRPVFHFRRSVTQFLILSLSFT